MKNNIITKTPWSEKIKWDRDYIIEDEEVKWAVLVVANRIQSLDLDPAIWEKIQDCYWVSDDEIIVELDSF